MPDFTSRHRSKLTDPTRVSKTKLERGMVAKIRYKKRDNTQRDMFVFILQPKFKNYFHCLDLKDCAPDKFTKLAEDLNEVTSTTPQIKKLDLSKLRVEVNSKQFYTSKLKNKDLQNGYRTLVEKNVGQITVYNYDYGVFDKIASRSERRQQEQVRKDDTDLETTQDTPPVGL
jgi:hypothetical protein|tara:strand:+ start:38 stop:553 length:516 start_codon:yes stop_codon:yes gene_type:complete